MELYYVYLGSKDTCWPIPVAVRSKAWVFGRSLTRIVGSNPVRLKQPSSEHRAAKHIKANTLLSVFKCSVLNTEGNVTY
jgi:hypothetical protein